MAVQLHVAGWGSLLWDKGAVMILPMMWGDHGVEDLKPQKHMTLTFQVTSR